MTFKTHYSSSSGNLYQVVAANGKRLLLECGVVWAKLQKALDHDLEGLEGCLVSHSHHDHCKSVREVQRAGIDVYASAETFEALGGITVTRRSLVMADMQIRHLPSFDVLAFATVHGDCDGSLGFVVREKETREYLLFAIDTAYLRQAFPYEFSIIAIGMNFDSETIERRVESGALHESVGRRILKSHPSVKWVKQYLTESVVTDKLREIHLLHGSAGNLDRDKAVREIKKAVPFVEVF